MWNKNKITQNKFNQNLIDFSTNPNFFIYSNKGKYNLLNAIDCLIPTVNRSYNVEEIIGTEISNKSLNELKKMNFFDEIINEIESDLVQSKISCVVQNMISIAQIDNELHENEKILIENSFLDLYNFYEVVDDERKFILKTYNEKDDFQLSVYLALLFTYFSDDSEKEYIMNIYIDLAFSDGKIQLNEYIQILNQAMLLQFPIEKFTDLFFSEKLKFHDLKKEKIKNYYDFNRVSRIFFDSGYANALIAATIEENRKK